MSNRVPASKPAGGRLLDQNHLFNLLHFSVHRSTAPLLRERGMDAVFNIDIKWSGGWSGGLREGKRRKLAASLTCFYQCVQESFIAVQYSKFSYVFLFIFFFVDEWVSAPSLAHFLISSSWFILKRPLTFLSQGAPVLLAIPRGTPTLGWIFKSSWTLLPP